MASRSTWITVGLTLAALTITPIAVAQAESPPAAIESLDQGPVTEILQVYGLTLTVSGGTPPTTQPPASPTAQPTGNPPGCGLVPAWNASTGYAPGAAVSHNGRRYEATWWSTGAEPGAPASWAVWADRGAC